jgi:hypothetical protein
MTIKKSKGKKKSAPKKPPRMPKPPAYEDLKCTPPKICEYLDKLGVWLKWLEADYTKLRVAVCNVEKQAFSQSGTDARPPKFCIGGATNEPLPPPPPPVW